MSISDLTIITKKIGVGIAVFLVPTCIVSGGLWATQNILKSKKHVEQVDVQVEK
jgi:hypothetical protein